MRWFNFVVTERLYGCETWSHTLGEEHNLRTLNKRMLRKTYGPERDEVKGQRGLQKEQITKYCSDGEIKENENDGEGETFRGKHRGTLTF
jgi:hypothetical protein